MCLACFAMSCTGATGCVEEPFGAVASVGSVVRDYTALLAYHDYPSARFNAFLSAPGTPVLVSYRFLETDQLPPISQSRYSVTGFWSFDGTQRAATRSALSELSATAGVVFVETTSDEAMISFHGSTGSTFAGWASYPSVLDWTVAQGTLVLNVSDGFAPGTSGYQVLLHELGHAVGLKHPFEGSIRLAPDLDATEQTQMSYSWSLFNATRYSPLDVQALQHLYGAAQDTSGWAWSFQGDTLVLSAGAAGDTLVGVRGANQLDGAAGDDLVIGGPVADTLSGGAGNDTLRGMGGDNLLLGGAGHDVIEGYDKNYSGLANDETLWGGGGNDHLTVFYGKNEVWAGPGNDTLVGGAAGNWFSADTLGGGAGDDVITALGGRGNELWGGPGNDTLTTAQDGDKVGGGAGDDSLVGGTGGDVLTGGLGNDTVSGDAGSDRLFLASGNDVGYGGSGNDTLFAGPGFDRMYGGTGADRFEFWRGAGWNRVEDFSVAEGDRLYLGSALWAGERGALNRFQVASFYGRFTPEGNAVLEFAGADTVVVLVGFDTSYALATALVII
jgi:Ca2+-binding RTX toxin-like protein